MPMTPIANSSYLDFTGYGISNATTVQAAYNLDPAFISPSNHPDLDVALILPRAQDPTALLASDWGTREQTLAQLNSSGTLWTTYGADPTLYNTVTNALQGMQDSQDNANSLAVQAATGDLTDVHNYTIAATEASLQTEMTVAVRDRAVAAFNQIMAMQI